VMRRRFQAAAYGNAARMGRRYYEPVPVSGKLKKVRRAVVLVFCYEMPKARRNGSFMKSLLAQRRPALTGAGDDIALVSSLRGHGAPRQQHSVQGAAGHHGAREMPRCRCSTPRPGLAYRRSAIKLLEEPVFGAHNEMLTHASWGSKPLPVALTN
jgi:hypothetical protein